MTDTNMHVQSAQLQKEIESYIGVASNSLIYDYGEKEGQTSLDLVTVNPRHQQSFLFHSVKAASKVECLREMLSYVKNYKEKESSYTIQWSMKNEDELHTSYFSAKNINAALDKFYYGRDANSIVVFSVILNPIA